MLRTFTASRDFTGKGNTIRRLFPSKGTGAQTVNVRANGASGAIQLQVQLPATSSKELDFSSPPLQIAGAVYVEVVGTGFAQGAIDLS